MGDHAGEAATTLGKCGNATALGFRPRVGLTFDEWLCAGRQISKISSASAWWLGDWLLYGERAYGKRYRAALELTSLDYKTLRNYAWVARSFEMSRRRDNLSFHHHAEVAGLREAEQDLWLARAETLRWSCRELRRQLAERRRSERSDDRRPFMLRMEIEHQRERRWREAATSERQELTNWLGAVADQAADAVLASDDPRGVPRLPRSLGHGVAKRGGTVPRGRAAMRSVVRAAYGATVPSAQVSLGELGDTAYVISHFL